MPFMSEALAVAKQASLLGEVPVGAVIVKDGQIIATAHNLVESMQDPTAHAEMLAIRAACTALSSPRLEDCDMFVTLEPCPMCAQAISLSRIRRLYFGAYDEKSGGVEFGARIFSHSTCHHKPEVYGGIAESDCAKILQDFFKGKR